MRKILVGLCAVAVLCAACSRNNDAASTTPAAKAAAPAKRFGNVDDARLANAHNEPQNWLLYNGGWHEQRFSGLDQINVDNVAQLKPTWFIEFDTNRGQESTPLVVDGVMYVTSAWSKVYALDAKSGKQLWFYDPKVPGAAGLPVCCDVVNRGVAVYQGKVFVGTIDGRLVALDAGTGDVVWSVMTVEPNSIYSITGAPRVARGKVFIGNGGADFGGRGYVSAYDAASGRMVWRFYTVPGDPSKPPDGVASDEVLAKVARPTWFGEWYKYGGGGQVWNALVFDPQFNQLYMATGNGQPWNSYYRSAGKGDNLFIASIVAVDADTGRYKWHYQETPGDSWDLDSISDIALVNLDVGGQPRKVLLHTPKNGFVYVIDRADGKLLSAEAFVPGVNWTNGIDIATGRPRINEAARYKDKPWSGVPGSGGAHNWNPIAFSPKTGLLYFAASEGGAYFFPVKDYKQVQGLPALGVSLAATIRGGGGAHGAEPGAGAVKPAAGRPKAYLLAWNPVTQKETWRADVRGGGVLATAGNLVFQGHSRDGVLGEFAAYRADTGEKLWSYRTPNTISSGPMTYSVDGEQYVAVSSGAGSMVGGGVERARQNGRLLVFKLNGTATLPPEPPLAPPPNPPQQAASAADQSEGLKLYDTYCGQCHGYDAKSANVIPDLRRTPLLTSKEGWQSVVIGGALQDRGMISWAKFIAPGQAEQIRLYVGEQARKLQKEEQATALP